LGDISSEEGGTIVEKKRVQTHFFREEKWP